GPAADRKASVATGDLLAGPPGAPGAPASGSTTLVASLPSGRPPGEAEGPAWLGNLPKILSDLGVGVVVWDDETPIYVSPLFSNMIGYTPEELGVRRPAHLYAETNGSRGVKGELSPSVPQFEFKLMHEFGWTLVHKNGHRVALEAAAGTILVGRKVEG